MKKNCFFCFVFAFVLSFGLGLPCECVESANSVKAATDTLDFNLHNLFENSDLFGKRPRDMAWSEDGRYLAYRWNVIDATGYDVWLYDTHNKKAEAITSVTNFEPFDPEAAKILKAMREGKAGEKDTPKYDGISSFAWSENGHELLLKYKKDLYRYKVAGEEMDRLTKTEWDENSFQFTKEGDGYLYWQYGKLYRIRFGDSFIEQIQPAIPSGRKLDHKILSPDQKWLVIVASKEKGSKPSPRKVGYVSFRDRFAKMKEHTRALAEDDKGPEHERWIYVQKIGERIRNATEETARLVYHHPGGKQHLDISKPEWSKDSQKFVFRTYNPATEEIFIYVAEADGKEDARVIHRSRNSGNQRSPKRVDPEFTPSGKHVIASFDDSGLRQPWLIDPITQGKVPVVRGNFDADAISFARDSGRLFVLANKHHPIQKDLYKVNVKTGRMVRLTTREGEYSNAVVSKNGEHFAALFRNWEQPVELVAGNIDEASEPMLTDSHKDTIAKLNQLKPELFSYKNKHGHTLHGMVFVPPYLNKKRKHPVVIYTYGGPLGDRGMVQYGGFGTYNYRFPMYMAKTHGYIAAVIDPRGSSNYGELFESANWQNPGEPQVQDLAAGVEYLVETYGGDPTRVGLYGWSFGGFVTQMALYTKPDVFTVGMAGAGPTEWRNYYGSYTSVTIDPFNEQEAGKKYSILPLAKNLKGRLMLLHGIEDTNVLFQDTVKVYQALMKAGKGEQVELVLDTTGGHHMGGDYKYNYIFWLFEDFLLRTLGAGYRNTALERKATASSTKEPHHAALANDGNLLTRWEAQEKKKQWWQVDLKRERKLIGAVVQFEQDPAPYSYTLQGSRKGETWEVLWQEEAEGKAPQTQPLFFEAEGIRFVRLKIDKAPKGEVALIRELTIYSR
ncbi:prolyl oligopeptidase family serine peptidase [bacterium]|nr:prolyl oligopeptidase family serine peptidase [bacterium]